MQLQITTTSNRYTVDIDLNKTVYELKRELSMNNDFGVPPEQQELLCAGRILANESTLIECNVNLDTLLVVLVQNHQQQPGAAPVEGENNGKESSDTITIREQPTTQNDETVPKESNNNTSYEAMVQNIASMGYQTGDVHLALLASYHNAELAVQSLIEGIPQSVLMPLGGNESNSDGSNTSLSPFEKFRDDPIFRSLRLTAREQPQMVHESLKLIRLENTELFFLITKNFSAFMNSLADNDYAADDKKKGEETNEKNGDEKNDIDENKIDETNENNEKDDLDKKNATDKKVPLKRKVTFSEEQTVYYCVKKKVQSFGKNDVGEKKKDDAIDKKMVTEYYYVKEKVQFFDKKDVSEESEDAIDEKHPIDKKKIPLKKKDVSEKNEVIREKLNNFNEKKKVNVNEKKEVNVDEEKDIEKKEEVNAKKEENDNAKKDIHEKKEVKVNVNEKKEVNVDEKEEVNSNDKKEEINDNGKKDIHEKKEGNVKKDA